MATTATNHWKLGLFVVVGIATAMGALFWIGARRFHRESFQAVTYFDESVQGLEVGSPVKFRGVTLGTVSDITIAPDRRHVQVTQDIYLDVVARLGLRTKAPRKDEEFIDPNLRTQLVSAGITGVRFLQTDFFDPERYPPPKLPFEPPWNYVPSAPSTLKSVEEAAVEIVNRFPMLEDRAKDALLELGDGTGRRAAGRDHRVAAGYVRCLRPSRRRRRRRARGAPGEPGGAARGARVGTHARRLAPARPERAAARAAPRRRRGAAMTRTRGLALACLLLTGCLGRDAAAPRFYRPDAVTLDAPADPSPADATGAPVRLRPVHEAGFLRERMIWRVSEVEYGRYEQRRWNELPAQYVARAMTNALQANPAVALTDDVAAPALALELLAFDEIVTKPRVARVIVRATLRGPKGHTLLDREFVVEKPITGDGGSAVAHAMGKALDAVTTQVTTEVATRLASAPAPKGGRR
jgi:ABC-type uncharacterized transport system auxiliary subunit